MQWKKDPNLKYTDLCIYVDAHIADIAHPGENPEIENTVYNYLWLVVKALAIKKGMFPNYQDYDGYAFYSANRLFFAIRKNYLNQGKTIKGKLIRPIKSCLNYMKKLLYPMKIEYQREAFRQVISEEFVSEKFDAFSYKAQLKADAAASQGQAEQFWYTLEDTFKNPGYIVDKVLEKSPFAKGTLEYKRLKMTLLLNSINALDTKKSLDCKLPTLTMWKLSKTMSSYTRVLLQEFNNAIKWEIIDCYKTVEIDDNMLEKLISYREDEEFDDENQH